VFVTVAFVLALVRFKPKACVMLDKSSDILFAFDANVVADKAKANSC